MADDTRWGQAVRHEWRLDPDFLTVNHGSFGATPLCVLAAQQTWRDRMETQPTRFMRAELPNALREAAAAIGAFVGADGRDIVFVDNATSGCNAVLNSFPLAPGDEVLVLDHGYNAVRNAVRFVTRRAGARMTEATVPFPVLTDSGMVDAVVNAITPGTRLVVIDHITSGSALVLPVAAIVSACHGAGVAVLIDGAHAPGQIDLDLQAIGADFYTGNAHKWLCAPKGCAFLHATSAWQTQLHPPVISHGLGQGYLTEFDWTGTRDFSAALSVGAALAFHQRLGGAELRQRNRDLARLGAGLISQRLKTEMVAGAAAMALVRLPMQGDVDETTSASVRDALLAAGTDAPTHMIAGGLWMRIAAFAYNDMRDFERLGDLAAEVVYKHNLK